MNMTKNTYWVLNNSYTNWISITKIAVIRLYRDTKQILFACNEMQIPGPPSPIDNGSPGPGEANMGENHQGSWDGGGPLITVWKALH